MAVLVQFIRASEYSCAHSAHSLAIVTVTWAMGLSVFHSTHGLPQPEQQQKKGQGWPKMASLVDSKVPLVASGITRRGIG